MNLLRIFLAVSLALAAGWAPVAHATIRREPVKLRLVGPPPVASAGDRVPLVFELAAAEAVTISGLQVDSRSLAAPFVAKLSTQRADPATPVRIPVEIALSESADPLVVRYEVDGEPRETSVDLSPLLASRRAARSAMVKVSDESVNPAGPAPALEQPSLAVPTGEDDPEVKPLPSETAPQSAQGRYIRVRGRLIYYRDGAVVIGADQIWVRAMDEDYGPDDTKASDYTDSQGYFDMTFWWDGDLGDGEPDLYMKFETESGVVTVQSTGLEIDYSWNTPVLANYTGSDYQLGTWAPADLSTHGAIHLYTNIRHNYSWYVGFESVTMPQTDVQWPEDGNGAWYNPFFEEIHISSVRTWWDDTHSHEYGHHYMNNFASSPDPEYCNGYCDSPECGHCVWCEETETTTVTEGWPNWIANVQTNWYIFAYGVAAARLRDAERIASCQEDGMLHDPTLTENFFAALLQDIWDSANEMDPLGFGGPDALFLETDEIFDVMDFDEPTSLVQFAEDFRARFPQHTVALWQTAFNSRINLDTQNPSDVTGLISTDHTPGVPSVDATIFTTWNASSDDWSGVVEYDYVIDRPDPQPDTAFVIPGAVAATYHLPPGTYSILVRARDRSGRTSPYAVIGPYIIDAPTPADLSFLLLPGWARPIVPRPAADAGTLFVPDPASLAGNSVSTYINYAYINLGQQAPLWGAESRLLLDGGLLGTPFTVTPGPGEPGAVVNRGPFTVRGGRHHLGGWLDLFDQWSESNEANNVWGRPWVWSPVAFTGGAGNNMRRSAPPGATAGWWTVKDGSPLYYTCDGIRWGATTFWNLVWMAADQDTSDFDLRLHFTSTGPQSGFDVVRGSSLRGPGGLEALVVNRNVWNGDLNWDIGVTNANGGGETYRISRRSSPGGLAVGEGVWAYTLPDSEYAALFSMWIYTGSGPVTVSAQGDPSEGPFYLAYLQPSFAYGGLSDPSMTIHASDSTGLARFHLLSPPSGDHGVLLFRDPKDGRGARTIELEAEFTPGDLAVLEPSGWHSPAVPRPAFDGTPTSVPLPDTLHGNTATTYFNIAGQNASVSAIPSSFTGRIAVDAMPVLDLIRPSATPGETFLRNLPVPIEIRGGRHTLTLTWDPFDVWPELQETNNHWGEQYVWSPLAVGLNAPVTRALPMGRTAGWDQLTSGEPVYFNVDGLRTPAFTAGPSSWAGVALMPGAGDADLQLHETATGTKSGFAGTLAVSAWGAGESDYVLMCLAQTAPRAFDVGVATLGGITGDYTLEVTTSTAHTLPPGGILGPFTLAAGRTVGLTEVALPVGAYTVRLLPVSGTADLGLSVHTPETAFQSKSEPVESSWLNAGGEIEEVTFGSPIGGAYCFAVWKAMNGDLGEAVQYQLEIVSTAVDAAIADVPASTQLAPAAPSPFEGNTTIAFDLARDGSIALEVFDVRGALVRTLAKGPWQAGKYRLPWNGQDEGGVRLSAGVYFIRLSMAGQMWHRKVIKLE